MSLSEAPYQLDAIDRRILRELQADGRITNLKLAEAVHLSPTAVLERVKRLARDGVILGYEARLNPAKLGAGLLVFIEVLLDRSPARAERIQQIFSLDYDPSWEKPKPRF